MPTYENVAGFHFAHHGHCMVRVAGSPDLVLLEEGDLLIVTRGAAHRLFCEPANEHHTLPLDRVIAISGFTGLGALVYGDGNDDAPPS